MAKPYSDDLRLKLLEAYEAGKGSLPKLASQFRVSLGYSKKIRAHQVRTAERARPTQLRHDPASLVLCASPNLSMEIVKQDVERCLDRVAYVQRDGVHRKVREVLSL